MSETTPPAPAPAPGPAPAPSPAPGISWLPDADADTVGFVQNKAWQSPADMLKGYRNLETFVGAERAGRAVILPADEADAKGWAQVYDKLGRPSSAEGYGLPVPEGSDPGFAKAAAEQFHKLGIPAKAGKELADWFNGQTKAAMDAAAAQEQQQIHQEDAQLSRDWGSERGARTELARRAAVSLGLDEGAIDAIQKTAGFSKTMKALAKMGDLLGEHKAEGFDAPGSFGMTPEAAKARKAQLLANAEWRTRAMNKNSAEWTEMQKLDRIITGT